MIFVTIAQKANMNQHVRSVHGNKKPFECRICDKGYRKRKKKLQIHVTSVHDEKKPFKCDICKTWFTERKSLKIHVT